MQEQLRKYANLAVRIGVNLQPGQLLIINTPVEQYAFARLVMEFAYVAGASEVIIDYSDDEETKRRFLHSDNFDAFPSWKVDRIKEWDSKNAAYLHLITELPDNLAGIDPKRIAQFSKVRSDALSFHTAKFHSYAIRWGLIVVPNPIWAEKLFPGDEGAMAKLWQLILQGSRATGDDPVGDWLNHGEQLMTHVDRLNRHQFNYLHFSNSLGTDLTVGLPQNHVWIGGAVKGNDKIPFFPNIPTEEIFTAPHRLLVDGKLIGSKPLIYGGKIIHGFSLTFEAGCIVNFSAESGYDQLAALLDTDAGTRYLGEIALVAIDSPLARTDTLFYNTLFDENTACHLGIGNANPSNLESGNQMTADEREMAGLNTSCMLVNATFGTSDMQVVGIRLDESKMVIMDKGRFKLP